MQSHLTHIALHVDNLQACIDFYQSFAGMVIVHERRDDNQHIVWLASNTRHVAFVIVLIPGGHRFQVPANDFTHLGFAVESRQMVDLIADKARQQGCLAWEPNDNPFPVGYYCGVEDPNGLIVEFSYGQPLGPGAETDLSVST